MRLRATQQRYQRLTSTHTSIAVNIINNIIDRNIIVFYGEMAVVVAVMSLATTQDLYSPLGSRHSLPFAIRNYQQKQNKAKDWNQLAFTAKI